MFLNQKYNSAEAVPGGTKVILDGKIYSVGNAYKDQIELYDLNGKFFRTIKYNKLEIVNIKFIILLRYNKSNMWSIVENYSDDGEVVDKNLIFGTKEIAEEYVKEMFDFDKEENGDAIEGLNYMIIPIPFDETIVESV